MMSMPHRLAMPLLTLVLGTAGVFAAIHAQAGVLYRCQGPNGSIAYTNKTATFTQCVELSRYADAPAKKAVSHKTVAKAPAADTTPKAKPGTWEYRENVPEKPEFKTAVAGVASTATSARATFSGVASTAMPLRATFAGVTSTAMPLRATFAGVTSTAMPLRATSYGVESTASLVRTIPAVPMPVATEVAKVERPLDTTPKPRILRGAVYRVQRANGITEYTNVKPGGGTAFAVLFTYIATCVACDVHSKIDFARTALNLDAFKDEIAAAAGSTGVDVALLRAVIHAESAFNPMAVSNKGAHGLMQLMPGTASDLGVNDAFDVSQNIGGGARYLAQLLKDFNGNTQLATAAYNAGEGAVQKYGGVPPYDETQVYVQRVEQLRDRYQKAL